MRRILFIILSCLIFPNVTYASIEFIDVVDPDNGSGTDYTSLSAWENSFGIIDLTSADTKVFSGTTTETLSDNVTVYQCRSGVYQSVTGTMTHDTATQALVKSITAGASFEANDRWYTNNTCNSANYFMISDTGDSAIVVAKCRSTAGSADTTAVTIDGFVTSATNYIKVWTDPNESYRHQGKWDTNKFRIIVSSGWRTGTITISDENVRIDGLQINNTGANDNVSGGIIIKSNENNMNINISNNIIRGVTNADINYYSGISVFDNNGSGSIKNWNNIIYDFKTNSIAGAALMDANDFIGATGNPIIYSYNNTAVNTDFGYSQSAEVYITKNSMAYNCTDNYYGTFDATSTNNLSGPGSDADIPATNARNGVTVIFNDEAGDDFHLNTSDLGARDNGTSQVSELNFSNDIDGENRNGAGQGWDVGADEVIHYMGKIRGTVKLKGDVKFR